MAFKKFSTLIPNWWRDDRLTCVATISKERHGYAWHLHKTFPSNRVVRDGRAFTFARAKQIAGHALKACVLSMPRA